MIKNKKLELFSTVPENENTPGHVFGNYGFRDENDDVVIEPQFICSDSVFNFGLCPVAINRTWYRDECGNRYFQMHYGYINEHGKVVIPAMFEDASPFNAYGVASVCVNYFDTFSYYFIDTNGSKIDDIDCTWINMHHRNDADRFIEFSTDPNYSDWDDKNSIGLFDSKRKKIIYSPIANDFMVYDDKIEVTYINEDKSYRKIYIDYDGNEI